MINAMCQDVLILHAGPGWSTANFLHSSLYGAVFQTGDPSIVANIGMIWLFLNIVYTASIPSVPWSYLSVNSLGVAKSL